LRINANAISISSSSSSVEQINDNNNYKDRMMMVGGGGPDKHGCYWDAGYEWCELASKCIQPFEESCPIEGPVLDFIGPQTIACGSNTDSDDYYGGKCILHSDECSFTAIDKSNGEPTSWTIGGKNLGNLNGTYIIYNNCTATCNGCSSITVVGGWNDDTSTTYDKDDDDKDYYATTTTFAGPLDFDCNNGSCNIINSDNDDDCKISAGGRNLTAQLSFVRGLKGNYSITNENCNISCRGCSAISSTEIYDFGCKGRGKCCDTNDGDFSCPELGQCVDSKKKSCPISTTTTTTTTTPPTPVLLNLHAKKVDATILPLLVVDVV
jgi:hypothetical protein